MADHGAVTRADVDAAMQRCAPGGGAGGGGGGADVQDQPGVEHFLRACRATELERHEFSAPQGKEAAKILSAFLEECPPESSVFAADDGTVALRRELASYVNQAVINQKKGGPREVFTTRLFLENRNGDSPLSRGAIPAFFFLAREWWGGAG
jgi:hypothetical protein